MFMRSLPQPPKSVSFGSFHARSGSFGTTVGRGLLMLVPPTIQSLPRSPNIASLPSLLTLADARHVPFGASEMQPLGVVRPSFLSKFRKNWWLTGGAPPVLVHVWPLGEKAVQLHVVPLSKNRIARRGSYSS